MLNFYMISSGSKGNSTVIWDEDDLIIIDCGITMKKFSEKTEKFDLTDVDKSIFISHEHSDHSKGVKTTSKNINADVYSKGKTLERLKINGYNINGETAIGNFNIIPVSVSHDAADPVVYIIKNRGIKISVVSDLGKVNESLINEMKNSNIMAIEANYDIDMLLNGKYPLNLKNRIKSDHGHLSNEQSAEAICEALTENTSIVLTHLSENNNNPDTALSTVTTYLKNRDKKYKSIECASQYYGSSYYKF